MNLAIQKKDGHYRPVSFIGSIDDEGNERAQITSSFADGVEWYTQIITPKQLISEIILTPAPWNDTTTVHYKLLQKSIFEFSGEYAYFSEERW